MKPETLPVYTARDELLSAIRTSPVVVVEGPTGCGKTTQLPQMIKDSGIIPPGMLIGVTQPRRLAAVSVAHRIASERGGTAGDEVGYAIRFDDCTSSKTQIKVMTDGILLQEARTDPELSRYGLLMIDEAHERSLNIDFTLGLLRRLLDRRPELRVVVSSATLDVAAFQKFFGDAPLVRVPAKPWPVEVRWQPMRFDDLAGRVEAVARVVRRLHQRGEPGHMLVFLTGEAEILGTLAELEQARLKDVALLPLFGRLTREEQERVFDDFGDARKIVLSTNIAETSITVPGVRYVVDLGLAKVPSHDPRTGIGRLREEPISRASAAQRAGRAGRTGPGICVRLYDKADYSKRPEYPLEDVLRMDLSDVVLRLIDLGVEDVEAFPFVTQPSRRFLRSAIRQLFDMGAIDASNRLTGMGKRMTPFPLSPRMARMVIEASDRYPDVFWEVLTVGALMSVRWPQVIPPGEREEAFAAHRRFSDPLGDLASGLRMVRAFEKAADPEEFCTRNYLDPTLLSEVLKIRTQLQEIARAVGVRGGQGGDVRDVNRCVLTAFSQNVCTRSRGSRGHETASGVRVAIHPGSCLWSARPPFFVATEIIQTSRTWARGLATLDPAWIWDVDPELAQSLGLRRRRGRRERVEKSRQIPDRVLLFGETYTVRFKRGTASIELPWSVVRDAGDRELELPEAQQKILRVSLVDGRDRWLSGLKLVQVLRLAPHLRLDESEVRGWPEGELFESDRDMHQLLRWVPHLLRPARSRRRKKPAFFTLIPNGAGGYWFEAATNIQLAVEQARLALKALRRESGLDESDRDMLEGIEQRFEECEKALKSA